MNSALSNRPGGIPRNSSTGQPFPGRTWPQAEVWTRCQSWGQRRPPPPQEVWQPRAKGSSQPGAEPEYRVFPEKGSGTLPSGGWPNGAKGTGKQGHQQAPQHELQAPAWAHMPLLCPGDRPQSPLRTGPELTLAHWRVLIGPFHWRELPKCEN